MILFPYLILSYNRIVWRRPWDMHAFMHSCQHTRQPTKRLTDKESFIHTIDTFSPVINYTFKVNVIPIWYTSMDIGLTAPHHTQPTQSIYPLSRSDQIRNVIKKMLVVLFLGWMLRFYDLMVLRVEDCIFSNWWRATS